MKEEEVTSRQWRRLYEGAIELKRLKPWEWMWDSELFGVQDPETGEVGYCCTMGRAGEHFALAAYRGSTGLEGHHKISSGEVDPDCTIDASAVAGIAEIATPDLRVLRRALYKSCAKRTGPERRLGPLR